MKLNRLEESVLLVMFAVLIVIAVYALIMALAQLPLYQAIILGMAIAVYFVLFFYEFS